MISTNIPDHFGIVFCFIILLRMSPVILINLTWFLLVSFSCHSQDLRPVSIHKTSQRKATLPCPSYFDTTCKIKVYTDVSIMPTYPGGSAAWQRLLNKNLKYPQDQIDSGELQSTATATFVVGTDGKLSCFTIKGKEHGEPLSSFEKMFLDVVKMMPDWKPGSCNKKIVPVRVMQPIVVCLSTE
jgi:hypothetical protein